jgi:hypothetical protein
MVDADHRCVSRALLRLPARPHSSARLGGRMPDRRFLFCILPVWFYGEPALQAKCPLLKALRCCPYNLPELSPRGRTGRSNSASFVSAPLPRKEAA